MTNYTHDDALRDLAAALDRCPADAVSGEWTATVMQANVSSREGGYRDSSGQFVRGRTGGDGAISNLIERLCDSTGRAFNIAEIEWRVSEHPGAPGSVRLDTRFDESVVPRAPDDPTYDTAASARRRFWEGHGTMSAEPVLAVEHPNAHAQTEWGGPHRRVYLVEGASGPMLVTDGLSTPWAGIPDRENGIGAEVSLPLAPVSEGETLDAALTARWAKVLLDIGDLAQDGFEIARDVERLGAILFCELDESCLPFTWIVLSLGERRIPDLPFGDAAVLRATPIPEARLRSIDPDEEWSATAARQALA